MYDLSVEVHKIAVFSVQFMLCGLEMQPLGICNYLSRVEYSLVLGVSVIEKRSFCEREKNPLHDQTTL